MTDPRSSLRPPKMEDLKAILAHAANHPAERQKLVDAPEDVLMQAGLTATTDAVSYLRSFGQIEFDDNAQINKPRPNEPTSDMGEV